MTISVGQKMGQWTVIDEPKRHLHGYKALCVCVCGNKKWVDVGSLKKGASKSCGCKSVRNKSPGRAVASDYPSPEVQYLLGLIANMQLLPADQFTLAEGMPAWTLSSFAIMLGTDVESLLTYIVKISGSRQTFG